MKKLFLAIVACMMIGVYGNAVPTVSTSSTTISQSVTFRTTQKMRGSDAEIYFYTDRTFQVYSPNGAFLSSGTWTISGSGTSREIFLYIDGELWLKGECRLSQGNLSWVRLNGVTYYKK